MIAVIFAWNNLWLGKLSELGNKYQKDALPTLLYGKIPKLNVYFYIAFVVHIFIVLGITAGFRFWVPVSILNFWYDSLSFSINKSFLDLEGLSILCNYV